MSILGITLRCDQCKYWGHQKDSFDWEDESLGMKKCHGVNMPDEIEDKAMAGLEKYPANEPTTEYNYDDVGTRWLEAYKRLYEKEKAYVKDGSGYYAALITRPDFFCARYAEKETSDTLIEQQ